MIGLKGKKRIIPLDSKILAGNLKTLPFWSIYWAMEINSEFDPKGKRILAISAHADDADMHTGGTFLKWLSEGATGAIVICTNGDKGSHDRSLTSDALAQIRHDEQIEASKILGLENTWFLDYPDSHLESTQELKEKLVKIVRLFKPDAVFTWDPTMFYSKERNMVNHPDHRACGEAVLDACFPMARDFLTFPDHQKEKLEAQCVCDIFLYNFDAPNYFVDISEVFDKKLELLKSHSSQLDSLKVEETLTDWNGRMGAKIGTKYAECFVHFSLHKD